MKSGHLQSPETLEKPHGLYKPALTPVLVPACVASMIESYLEQNIHPRATEKKRLYKRTRRLFVTHILRKENLPVADANHEHAIGWEMQNQWYINGGQWRTLVLPVQPTLSLLFRYQYRTLQSCSIMKTLIGVCVPWSHFSLKAMVKAQSTIRPPS